ncbi:type VII secretion-associated serine protease mycosin [Streptomyces iconiensis]|uniref:Type VII secretion-associated serine protease mycosin n=1 Tax=Streptomyces iconiensis TaxID=1384038 RepID=A0ABT6ZUY3_9ACTN|nr:type VII secretion-associated serine protease mycosin [Streptomyces iconiensis]MDJ1132253.1 type VII secretion-associated serine protease mycosin [Streptomyces iconiensis]
MKPRTAPRSLAVLLSALLALAPVTAGTAHAQGEGVQAQEWGLKALEAKAAWKTTKGKGVTVAVLDTGVDASHPDLRRNVGEGKDLVRMGATKGDRAWARHGTAMAGIIAGHGHGESGSDGVLGVAPEARILPVRVLLEDTDPQRKKARDERGSALADGIRWAADQGADVINLSLGDDSNSAHPEAGEDAAVRYALGKGSVVVASAGNGGEKGDHVSYPAAYPGVIAVAAVDRYDARAAFSTRRWYATVAAPGKDIVIADPDRTYYEGWGTSAAAAFVSGAVALVRAAHPDLSPSQIKELIADTARNTPEGGRSDAVGTGVVDPAAAIEMGTHVKARKQRPTPGDYHQQYFGAGPATDGGSPGWFAAVAAVVGALLIAAALAVWRGFTPRGLRSLRALPTGRRHRDRAQEPDPTPPFTPDTGP